MTKQTGENEVSEKIIRLPVTNKKSAPPGSTMAIRAGRAYCELPASAAFFTSRIHSCSAVNCSAFSRQAV